MLQAVLPLYEYPANKCYFKQIATVWLSTIQIQIYDRNYNSYYYFIIYPQTQKLRKNVKFFFFKLSFRL